MHSGTCQGRGAHPGTLSRPQPPRTPGRLGPAFSPVAGVDPSTGPHHGGAGTIRVSPAPPWPTHHPHVPGSCATVALSGGPVLAPKAASDAG